MRVCNYCKRWRDEEHHFCPWCGAKLAEEKKESAIIEYIKHSENINDGGSWNFRF